MSIDAIKKQLLLAACPSQPQQGARQVACLPAFIRPGIPFKSPQHICDNEIE